MSATGRSNVRLRDDTYVTPEFCVHRLLERVQLAPSGLVWMDPCAGEGAIIKAVESFRGSASGNKPGAWVAVEKREECREPLVQLLGARGPNPRGGVCIGDFLDRDGPARVSARHRDVVIMNPPYSLAQEFIEESMGVAHVVAALLRLNYLASETRAEFMQRNTPDVYVVPNRPQFRYGLNPETGKMFGTDATEYAWMVWTEGLRERRPATIEVLDLTPRVARVRPRIVRRPMVAKTVRRGMVAR